jgi:hypothetical protein
MQQYGVIGKVGDRAVYIRCRSVLGLIALKRTWSGQYLLNLGTVSTLTTTLCNLDILVRWNY